MSGRRPDKDEMERRYREGYEAFNDGDYGGAVNWMHEDVVMETIGPDGEIRGRDAVLAFMQPEALLDLRIEVLDLAIYDELLIVHHIARARGAGSGIPVAQEGWQVWWFDEEGLGIRSQILLSRDEALRAAGLEAGQDP